MAPNTYSAKSVLEEALHKARDAVYFDYQQKFQDAIRAYGQSCTLLRQVMSLDVEDRIKLEAIVWNLGRICAQ